MDEYARGVDHFRKKIQGQVDDLCWLLGYLNEVSAPITKSRIRESILTLRGVLGKERAPYLRHLEEANTVLDARLEDRRRGGD